MTLTIEPTGAILGATVSGIDLAQPIPEAEFGRILLALGAVGHALVTAVRRSKLALGGVAGRHGVADDDLGWSGDLAGERRSTQRFRAGPGAPARCCRLRSGDDLLGELAAHRAGRAGGRH